jgi:RNase P protein component
VYEEGVKQVGRLFVLYLYPGDDLARAVVASRKVGGAVTRNRAKRLLRVAIRERIETPPGAVVTIRDRHCPDPTAAAGLWVVAVARTKIVGARAPEVCEELDRLLERPPAPAANRGGPDAGRP